MSLSIAIPSKPDQLTEDVREQDLDNFLLSVDSIPPRELIFFDELLVGYILYKNDQTVPAHKLNHHAFLNVSITPGESVSDPTRSRSATSSPVIASTRLHGHSSNGIKNESNGIKNDTSNGIKNDTSNGIKNGVKNGDAPSQHYQMLSLPLSSDDIIFQGVSGVDDSHYTVWRFEIPISYPRKKLSDPKLLFTCSLTKLNTASSSLAESYLDSSDKDDEKTVVNDSNNHLLHDTSLTSHEDVLPDFEPGYQPNLLSELNNQISSASPSKYYLSDSFLNRADSPDQNHRQPLETEQHAQASEKPVEIAKKPEHLHLQSTSLCLPVTVSLVIKLKSTKPAGRNNILLATLNIESSDDLLKYLKESTKGDIYTDYYFNILDLSMEFRYGVIENFQSPKYKFPIKIKLADSINLTYKLINNEILDKELKSVDSGISAGGSLSTPIPNVGGLNLSKPIGITLVLQIVKHIPDSNTYENVSNIVTTNWSPFLDFSIVAPPINSSLKTTATYSQSQIQSQSQSQSQSQAQYQPRGISGKNPRKAALMNSMQKSKTTSFVGPIEVSSSSLMNPVNSSTTSLGHTSNPPSASITANNTMASFNISNTRKLNRPLSSASSVTVNLTTNNNSTLSGLKLTFKGKLNITLGEFISWKLQAINTSSNTLNLSLIVQNPINFNPLYSTSSTNNGPSNVNNVSSSNLLNTANQKFTDDVLVYNRLQLHQLYTSLKLESNGVIILNNDIRIGPIEPNSVFETDLKLIGISKGIYNLDGIKIFDINSGDGIDFGKLVEVFVV